MIVNQNDHSKSFSYNQRQGDKTDVGMIILIPIGFLHSIRDLKGN